MNLPAHDVLEPVELELHLRSGTTARAYFDPSVAMTLIVLVKEGKADLDHVGDEQIARTLAAGWLPLGDTAVKLAALEAIEPVTDEDDDDLDDDERPAPRAPQAGKDAFSILTR